jgi:hypothetical protein
MIIKVKKKEVESFTQNLNNWSRDILTPPMRTDDGLIHDYQSESELIKIGCSESVKQMGTKPCEMWNQGILGSLM